MFITVTITITAAAEVLPELLEPAASPRQQDVHTRGFPILGSRSIRPASLSNNASAPVRSPTEASHIVMVPNLFNPTDAGPRLHSI
jgi:hypothetical protein